MPDRQNISNLFESYRRGELSTSGFKQSLESLFDQYGTVDPSLRQSIFNLGDDYRLGKVANPALEIDNYLASIPEPQAAAPEQPIPQASIFTPSAPVEAPESFFSQQQPSIFEQAPIQQAAPFQGATPTQAIQPSIFSDESLSGLVPGSRFPTIPFEQEAKAFEGVSRLEQSDLDRARQAFLSESTATQPLFLEAGRQEEADFESARQRAMEEARAALQESQGQFRSIFAPEYERQLQRNAESLRARQGLGSGGFSGSGAFQALAARNAADLERSVLQSSLPNFLGAQQQFSDLGIQARTARSPYRRAALENRLGAQDRFADMGFEARLTPATYRRSLFERGLGENERLAGAGMDFELADQARGSAIDAARSSRRGSRDAAIIGGLGSIGGGLLGGGLFNRRQPYA